MLHPRAVVCKVWSCEGKMLCAITVNKGCVTLKPHNKEPAAKTQCSQTYIWKNFTVQFRKAGYFISLTYHKSTHRNLLESFDSCNFKGLQFNHIQWVFSSPCLSVAGGSENRESNVGDPGSISGLGRSPGKGNGNPLQYSRLENPIDRGAWRATVQGAAKSWTRLSNFTSLHFTYRCWFIKKQLFWNTT